MATNPYLDRLQQLDTRKIDSVNQMAVSNGLPLQKPTNLSRDSMAGDPRKPQEEDPLAKAMDSDFARNLQGFSGEDKRFDGMMKEFTSMANGLKQMVEKGYMPKPIAEQRIRQYVQDSANYFSKNQPKPMDNPELAGAVEGMLAQQMGGQQSPEQMPPQEGMPPQEPQMGGM